MSNPILDGLSLLDPIGLAVLSTNVACLIGAVAAHGALRARYTAFETDLERSAASGAPFASPLLQRIVRDAETSARRSREPNVQAIIEDGFRADIPGMLLAERFLRSATSLVLILGLLGTFYGLTASVGRLVHLVSADAGTVGDVTQAVTHGLTDALTGMAVAFSNSLVGVGSAVLLTLLGVVNNVADRRTALMVQLETHLDRVLSGAQRASRDPGASVGDFGDAVARLEGAVARFEGSLRSFAASTKDLREVHLVVALRPEEPR
jgi:hypothetical protein